MSRISRGKEGETELTDILHLNLLYKITESQKARTIKTISINPSNFLQKQIWKEKGLAQIFTESQLQLCISFTARVSEISSRAFNTIVFYPSQTGLEEP